jgi:hypothetical protein
MTEKRGDSTISEERKRKDEREQRRLGPEASEKTSAHLKANGQISRQKAKKSESSSADLRVIFG